MVSSRRWTTRRQAWASAQGPASAVPPRSSFGWRSAFSADQEGNSLHRQKLNRRIPPSHLEIKVSRHKTMLARIASQLHTKRIDVGKISLNLDQRSPHRPITISRHHLNAKRTQPREHHLHSLLAVSLASDAGHLAPMHRR